MTANDLLNSALKDLGVLASGEVMSGAEAQDGLVILNHMMDAWSADRLTVFTVNRVEVIPASLKQAYTLGVGGDFNITRPAKIQRYSVENLANPSAPLELDLTPLSDDEWAAIPVKNVSSALPKFVWDDGGFPLRTLSFWPIPNVQVNFVIYGWAMLSQFADLVTDYTFPPGYLEALRTNLAIRLAPQFGASTQVSPITAKLAETSLARIKVMNVQPIKLMGDGGLSGGGGHYDWRADVPVGR